MYKDLPSTVGFFFLLFSCILLVAFHLLVTYLLLFKEQLLFLLIHKVTFINV